MAASANVPPGAPPAPPAIAGVTHHVAGGLPYTGADLWLYLAIGLLLILAGVLARWHDTRTELTHEAGSGHARGA